jgi:hypothetical protein
MSCSTAVSFKATLALILVNVLLAGALAFAHEPAQAAQEQGIAQLCSCQAVYEGYCVAYENAGCSHYPPETCGIGCD